MGAHESVNALKVAMLLLVEEEDDQVSYAIEKGQFGLPKD